MSREQEWLWKQAQLRKAKREARKNQWGNFALRVFAAVFVAVTNGLLLAVLTDAPEWGCVAVALLSATVVIWGREP